MDFPFALSKVTALKWRETPQLKAKALVKIGKPFQTACFQTACFQTACLMTGYAV
jgi:hypothetical protein